jgi:DDE_Tnp_1-associated
MPALSSSAVDPALCHLADLADDARAEPPGLLAVLARVADPRRRRGVRYRLAVVLGLAVYAVLAGARSFTAIAEWAADADTETLAGLGVSGAVPSESAFRRTLQRLDAGAFDELAGHWAARRTGTGPAAGHRRGRQHLARLRRSFPARPSPAGWPSPTPPRPSRSRAAAQSTGRGPPNLLRGHLAERHPGQPRRPRRHHPRPLGIEDRLHWVRDLDFDEDRSQIRTAAGPQIMASPRNLAITILRLAGPTSIAAALRYHPRRPARRYEQSSSANRLCRGPGSKYCR